MNHNWDTILTPVRTGDLQTEVLREGALWHLKLKNTGSAVQTPGKVALLEGSMPFRADTPIYGEGYNKLSQYGGTVEKAVLTGSFGDRGHYRLPAPDGMNQVYSLLLFLPEGEEASLLGFCSCRRFSGEFWFSPEKLQVVVNLEGIEIAPGETLELETLFIADGSRTALLDTLAEEIGKAHPMLPTEEIPTGWSSWLVYGPDVTAEGVLRNLDAIRDRGLGLKYIQLDDGYQAHMGDWLTCTEGFAGGGKELCLQIREAGFEPAIWVAPFIAEESSEVFRSHPDWFVKDEAGAPLPSNRVSFGGWRCGPWYMLDGTHPGARAHLTHVFRTMRQEWGVRYFKLDANMWGALPFGVRHEKNRTSVEAYRMGMEAVLEGAGRDSFLLGCNAPMWPSLGVVHGMRITNDNSRDFRTFRALAMECFSRNWQNGRLWVNDPDTVLLKNSARVEADPSGSVRKGAFVTSEEFLYNAAYTLASGGMVLSSDDITRFTEAECGILKRLLPPTGAAAVFEDNGFRVGRITLPEQELVCLFGHDDAPRTLTFRLSAPAVLTDFWTDECLGHFPAGDCSFEVEGRSARVIRVQKD